MADIRDLGVARNETSMTRELHIFVYLRDESVGAVQQLALYWFSA
jgi:hypothetical protein